MISWEIKELDEALGGMKKHSLILIHEVDPRSRGKELLYHIMKEKLKEGNLVGYFNLSYPVHMLINTLEKLGIPLKTTLKTGHWQ